MAGFLNLLGLAPPPPPRASPNRLQQQSPVSQTPEFSLAELRRVHGVLLVSLVDWFDRRRRRRR
jgi:hypothetical protein